MRPRTLIGLAAVAALVAAAPAQAVIRPQKGMAGVRLDMTQDQVKAKLGQPVSVRHGSNPFGTFTQFAYPHRLTVTFQGDTNVTSVSTTARRERTARGVGVGSPQRDVLAKVRHSHCDTTASVHTCEVGKLLPGHRVTSFLISRRGHVVSVTVGFVVD
jgi:hypothetical protein